MSQLREQDFNIVPRLMRWVLRRACQVVSDDCPITIPSPDVTQVSQHPGVKRCCGASADPSVELGNVPSRDTLYEGFLGLRDTQEALTGGEALEDSVIAGITPYTEQQIREFLETTASPQAAAVSGSVSEPPENGRSKRWISPLQLTASPKCASTDAESTNSPSSTTFSTTTNSSSRSSTPSPSDNSFKLGNDCSESEAKFEASNTYKKTLDETVQELRSLLKVKESTYHIDLNDLKVHYADKVRSEDHLITKIDNLRLDIQSQKQSMDKKDATIAQMTTELARKDHGLSETREKLQVAEDLTQITTAANAALVQKLEDCEKELGETEFLLNKSWHQYSGAREQFASCALEKAQLTDEVDELKEKLKEAKEDAASREKTLKSTASDLQRLTRLSEARDGFAELEAENAGLLLQIEEMIKEKSTLYSLREIYFQQREVMVVAANRAMQQELQKRWDLQQWAISEVSRLGSKQDELEKALEDEKLKSKASSSFVPKFSGRRNTNLFSAKVSEQSLSNTNLDSWKRENPSPPPSPEQQNTFPTYRRPVPETKSKAKQGPFDLNSFPTEDPFMTKFGPQPSKSQEWPTEQAQQPLETGIKQDGFASMFSTTADQVTDPSDNQCPWAETQSSHQGQQGTYQYPHPQAQTSYQGQQDSSTEYTQGGHSYPDPATAGPFGRQSEPQYPQPQISPFEESPPDVIPYTQAEFNQENSTGEATYPTQTSTPSWAANDVPSNPWNKATSSSQPFPAQNSKSPSIWDQTSFKTRTESNTKADVPQTSTSEQNKSRTTSSPGLSKPAKDKRTKNKQRAALRRAAKARAYGNNAVVDSNEME